MTTSPTDSLSGRPPTTLRSHHSGRRDSSISSLSELTSNLRRRSVSLRSRRAGSPYVGNLALDPSAEPKSASAIPTRPALTLSTTEQQSPENLHPGDQNVIRTPISAPEAKTSRVLPFTPNSKKEEGLKPPPSIPGPSGGTNGISRSLSVSHAQSSGGIHNPRVVFQHIQDVTSKRIATLDYLRKAHEGRVYWFNALRFKKSDLSKMPYFDPRKLGRRATNYLFLGVSIPAVVDPNKDVAIEYLRAFNSVLAEFESYQAIHSPEGTATSSLSRARIPQMFKRATQASAPKGRRGSAAEAFAHQNAGDPADIRSTGTGPHSASSGSFSTFPASDPELTPGEEYSFLLTPSLPFDPDYFETFATLCDVLIDCYTRIMSLANSPEAVTPGIAELFSKADTKVRKIMVASLVRDFEESSRQGIKTELAGVGKVVLGGLVP